MPLLFSIQRGNEFLVILGETPPVGAAAVVSEKGRERERDW